MKYKVTMEEELTRVYEVEADSEDQAVDKATDRYNSGDNGLIESENITTDTEDLS